MSPTEAEPRGPDAAEVAVEDTADVELEPAVEDEQAVAAAAIRSASVPVVARRRTAGGVPFPGRVDRCMWKFFRYQGTKSSRRCRLPVACVPAMC